MFIHLWKDYDHLSTCVVSLDVSMEPILLLQIVLNVYRGWQPVIREYKKHSPQILWVDNELFIKDINEAKARTVKEAMNFLKKLINNEI